MYQIPDSGSSLPVRLQEKFERIERRLRQGYDNLWMQKLGPNEYRKRQGDYHYRFDDLRKRQQMAEELWGHISEPCNLHNLPEGWIESRERALHVDPVGRMALSRRVDFRAYSWLRNRSMPQDVYEELQSTGNFREV